MSIRISVWSKMTLLFMPLLAACNRDSGARGPRLDEVPSSAGISSATFTSGLALGVLRKEISVAAFKISQSVVSVREYRACVDAGTCTPPALATHACKDPKAGPLAGSNWGSSNPDKAPMTCASVAQAKEYCHWVGGELPTAEQWLYAARGAEVHRYAWGDGAGDCSKHPGNAAGFTLPAGIQACAGADYSLHSHPAARSPLGIEDVLLTPAELLGPSAASLFGACAGPSSCLVRGRMPGAIDAFDAVPDGPLADASVPTFSFRCVWSEDSQ